MRADSSDSAEETFCAASSIPLPRRGQRSLVGLSLAIGRHRHQYAIEERHNLGADDLCPVGVPDPTTAGQAVDPVALVGLAGHSQRQDRKIQHLTLPQG